MSYKLRLCSLRSVGDQFRAPHNSSQVHNSQRFSCCCYYCFKTLLEQKRWPNGEWISLQCIGANGFYFLFWKRCRQHTDTMCVLLLYVWHFMRIFVYSRTIIEVFFLLIFLSSLFSFKSFVCRLVQGTQTHNHEYGVCVCVCDCGRSVKVMFGRLCVYVLTLEHSQLD